MRAPASNDVNASRHAEGFFSTADLLSQYRLRYKFANRKFKGRLLQESEVEDIPPKAIQC